VKGFLMLELNNPYRKNKINLADYDYQKDIQNRLVMARFSPEDLEVLEEILYSPPKLPVHDLVETLDLDKDVIQKTVTMLQETGLFTLENDTIIMNKEMRKYFEAQILKFEEGFTPGMEFLQSLLKKVPIHVLPTWYPIPRTSDNIFDSIVEKYLETPQTYQRYLLELNLGDDILSSIVEDVFNADNFRLFSDDIKEKYGISNEKFEEHMLHLEFNFVCCLVYNKIDGKWKQVVTPFHEWREYLRFRRENQPKSATEEENVVKYRPTDFAFVDDMTTVLEMADAGDIVLKLDEQERWIPETVTARQIAERIGGYDLNIKEEKDNFNYYISQILRKIIFVKLGRIDESVLKMVSTATEWLNLPIERRALSMYKHTLNNCECEDISADVATEKNIREIEKTISNLIDKGWIYFDDYLKGITASLSEESSVVLKKVGRYWRYTIPVYNDAELTLIRKTILEWLFEAGIISIGTYNAKACFSVTSLGKKMFS
jgi:predicted transcriptional regulator